jgi:hypothetical protein
MAKYDRWLRLAIRILGVVEVLAVAGIVMPASWMAAAHERLGMGPMPEGPVVGYLARSCSALYAMQGALFLYLSMDVVRRRDVIRFMGWVFAALAPVALGIELLEGLPLYWTVGEPVSVVVTAAAILVLASKAERAGRK